MTKVHAFQIVRVDDGSDWMVQDYGDYDRKVTVFGARPKEYVTVDNAMAMLFDPQPGHYCIVWPHGLVTFRPEESFKADFTYKSGTVWETELEALFQKGMMSPEGQRQLAVERLAKKIQLQINNEKALRRMRAMPTGYWHPSGSLVRRVVPGLLPAPQGFTR